MKPAAVEARREDLEALLALDPEELREHYGPRMNSKLCAALTRGDTALEALEKYALRFSHAGGDFWGLRFALRCYLLTGRGYRLLPCDFAINVRGDAEAFVTVFGRGLPETKNLLQQAWVFQAFEDNLQLLEDLVASGLFDLLSPDMLAQGWQRHLEAARQAHEHDRALADWARGRLSAMRWEHPHALKGAMLHAGATMTTQLLRAYPEILLPLLRQNEAVEVLL